MSSLISLPEDVLINKILLKLDTKSLMNLRCVCKYLRRLITSPAFVKMHYHHQLNNDPQVLVYNTKHLCWLNFNGTDIDPSHPKIVEIVSRLVLKNPLFFGSCNGLLCLVERCDDPLSLWNPTTKEYKRLPPSLPALLEDALENIVVCEKFYDDVAYGLGYDRIIDDYKVIQCQSFLAHDVKYSITEFQVYTLGTDTWRRINDNPYESYFTTQYHYRTPGIFVNGALHWIMREEEYSESKIIVFDIEKEIFRAEVPKPHSRLSDFCNDKWSLHKFRECLCINNEDQEGSHVWMMKDYGVIDSWTKLFKFASPYYDLKVLKCGENREFLVAGMHAYKQILFHYDLKKRKLGGVLEEIGEISNAETHIESLVSLNTGIYRYGMVETSTEAKNR